MLSIFIENLEQEKLSKNHTNFLFLIRWLLLLHCRSRVRCRHNRRLRVCRFLGRGYSDRFNSATLDRCLWNCWRLDQSFGLLLFHRSAWNNFRLLKSSSANFRLLFGLLLFRLLTDGFRHHFLLLLIYYFMGVYFEYDLQIIKYVPWQCSSSWGGCHWFYRICAVSYS